MKDTRRGFTLVDMLLVVAIIGIISSVVLSEIGRARERAQIAVAKIEMRQFITMVEAAILNTGLPLGKITGTNCSMCYTIAPSVYAHCGDTDIRNVPTTDPCYVNWVSALDKIRTAAGGFVSGLEGMDRDPWGSPYVLDENLFERVDNPATAINETCDILDYIVSRGSDGVKGGSGKDIMYRMPAQLQCP